MGSTTSSSRSPRTKTPLWTTLQKRMVPVLAWCSAHRGLSLGCVTAVGFLLGASLWIPSPPSPLDDQDDEIASLGEFDEFASEIDDVEAINTVPAPVPRAVFPSQIDDLAPLLAGNHELTHGIMTATFEGTPRSIDTGPVWLAGTIETEDLAPQAELLPEFPSAVPQAGGPLLIPQ